MQIKKNRKTGKYTLEKLYQDISRQIEKEEGTDNNGARDIKHKLKVISYTISLAQKLDEDKDHDWENVIKCELSNDESLFAYTFYIASHSQFEYSWSYLRTKWEKYEIRLTGACTFILDMIDKTNKLLEHFSEFRADSFVFADLFVLSIDKEKDCPYMEIQWEALNNIFQLGKGYFLSAKKGKGIIMTHFLANKKNEIDIFINQLKDWKE